MARTAFISLPLRSFIRGRRMGMPPPTLASNSRWTPFFEARASRSGPCFAMTSLLAVTTDLPASNACRR